MKVRIGQSEFRAPYIEDDAESVLVFDDYGNPVIVIQKIASGQIAVVKATEPGFAEVLKDYGVGLQASVKVVRK